ncbi:MAG: hypothetical protein H7175_02390 [Burkholderiales bacterium]|nr:hypothetical protein [Anaerolineae bacterium]
MKTKHSLVGVFALAGLLTVLSISGMAYSQDTTHAHDEAADAPISAEDSRLIADVREFTAGFRDFAGIEDAGYGKFLDCFVNNDIGGMGQHYVNGDLVGDDVVDPMLPEALVYEPTEDGEMILVAFEYLVFADVWDPDNTGREAPMVFNRPMHLKTNIPDTPPVWTMHLWLWTTNPGGIFADYNPLVFCPSDQPITDLTPAT